MRSQLIKGGLVFAIVFLAYFYYKRNIETSQVEPVQEPLKEQKLSSDFKSFYEQFQSDSVFQLSHIAFPLERISDKEINDLTPWTRETWKVHRPFNDMNGAFERSFVTTSGIVNEYIIDLTGEFTMNRRFAKLSDGWNLIHYKPMGQYGLAKQTQKNSNSGVEIKQLR